MHHGLRKPSARGTSPSFWRRSGIKYLEVYINKHAGGVLRVVESVIVVDHQTDILACLYILHFFSNDVSCEFDEFRVDTHLCMLRTMSVARL